MDPQSMSGAPMRDWLHRVHESVVGSPAAAGLRGRVLLRAHVSMM